MSNVCSVSLPGSINADCVAPMQKIKNVIILEPGTTFSSLSDFLNLSTWKAFVDTTLKAWIPVGLEGHENTTDDPEIQTSGQGGKFVANEPPPSLIAYLSMNFCDYKEVLNVLKGGTYEIIYELNDGSLYAYRAKGDNVIRGFKARINAVTKGFTDPAAIANFYRVMINHTSIDEFKNYVVAAPAAWTASLELVSYMPSGLNMMVTTPYSDPTVVVEIYDRCGDAKTGLVLADFEIVETNASTKVITGVTDNSDGTYDIDIDATGTGLTASEYSIIRVKKGAGPYTDLSNKVLVVGG